MNEPLAIADAIRDLPLLPPVAVRIASVVANAESSADAVVDALKLDPVIAGKVLKLANSAYVGIPRTISSVKNAVVLLGRNRIHSLVVATTTLSALKPGQEMPFSMYRFWKHSITVAMIAESIAKHLKRYDPIDAEDVFSAGLLHDIGKLVLGVWNGEKLRQCIAKSLSENVPFYTTEEPPVSHCAIGGALCDRWNFPKALKNAIVMHHSPQQAGEFSRIVSIVHLSDVMAHIIGSSTFDREPLLQLSREAAEEVKLPAERLRVISDDALKNEKSVESFIDFLN